MLFIEYDVDAQGQIELVALINAIEDDGQDVDGSDWLGWRRSEFDDDGAGCVGVTPDELAVLEATERSRAASVHRRADHPGRPGRQGGGGVVSTTRSQLYRLARDLGNVEAVEHGYQRGGLSRRRVRRRATRGSTGDLPRGQSPDQSLRPGTRAGAVPASLKVPT